MSFTELSPAERRQYFQQKIQGVLTEVGKVVVGQQYMLNRLLCGLFTDGHVLLEGVPGLAKTLTVNTLARVLNLDFKRLQFTPDLLPADLIGTMIFNQKEGNFEVKKGPIFANLILADEINRSPAKVQSALLEAMQEKQVTIGDTTYRIQKPFLVLATQNPVEQDGTYPLPEAQLDRFMMKIFVDYPSRDEELAVMRRMADIGFNDQVNAALTTEEIFAIRDDVNTVVLSESLENYIIELVFATRKPEDYDLKEESRYIQYGSSPRGTIALARVARSLAYLDGREYVLPDDVKEAARDVLNHRIILNYEAEAEGITSRQLLDRILAKVSIVK